MRYMPKGYFFFNEELAKIFPPVKDRSIVDKQKLPEAVAQPAQQPMPPQLDPAVVALMARYNKKKENAAHGTTK